MKVKFPVLMVIFELGTFLFTFRLSAATPDPYTRYLVSVKANKPEASVGRFANECGIDLAHVPAKFAVSPGGGYKVVRNLAAGMKTLESDFYTSVEVHSNKSKALVILWPNDDAEGVDIRELLCYVGDRLEKAEMIYWEIPQDPDFKGDVWGYQRRWERESDGKLFITKQGFVNTFERPIQKPKFDAEQEKDLQWTPDFGSLSKLKLPTALFQ